MRNNKTVSLCTPPFPAVIRDDLLTDLGRAEAMARMYDGWAYYRPEFNGWMVWDSQNGRWVDCSHPRHQGLWDWHCQQFLAQCAERAAPLGVEDRQKRKMLSHGAWATQRRLTRYQSAFPIAENSFDGSLDLLGVGNGVLDLDRGKLLEASPDQLVSTHLSTFYDSQATSADWDGFLAEITGADPDYQQFLQEHFGVMLGGRNYSELFTFLHGSQDSGASTFIRMILDIFGPYGLAADPKTFQRHRPGATRGDLAEFDGKRLVAVTEWPKGFPMDPHSIKQLSGRDPISVRRPRKGMVEINPTWSVAIACDALPRFEPDTTSNIWRHVLVLPFQRLTTGRDDEWDRRLASPEAHMAILAWLVAGYRAYFTRPSHVPIQLPNAVTQATADYRARHD